MDTPEIRIETECGTLIVYADQRAQHAGIALIPKGADETIDVIYAECVDIRNKDAIEKDHGPLKRLRVFEYSNVYDKTYTHDFIIDSDNARRAVTEDYSSDSAKL